MKQLPFVFVAIVIAVTLGQKVNGAPISTTLTLTNDSQLTLFLSAVGGAVETDLPFDLSGTIDVTLDDAIDDFAVNNDTTSLSLDDAAIDLSDESVLLDTFANGVTFDFSGLGINTLSSNGAVALATTDPTDPFEYSFDPGGGSPTELSIDEGLFTYLGTGPIGGLIGSGTVNFTADPSVATLPSVGQVGLVTQDATLIGNTLLVDVIVSIPLTFADTLQSDSVSGLEIAGSFAGAIVATGSYTTIVPEPSSVVLLGIAMIAAIPLWRRLFA